MRTRYRLAQTAPPYFITCTTMAWLPVFTRKPYCDLLLHTLQYCRQHKGLKIFAYVIMDNHLHLVVQHGQLAKVIKEFKTYSTRKIIEQAQADGKDWLLNQFRFFKQQHRTENIHQVWQEGYFPKQIQTEDMLRQKIDYLHANPVRAGLVARPEDWLYSSARNYLSGVGLMEIDTTPV